jgi:hypothetical protein
VEKIVNHREYGFAKNIRQYAKAFWSKCQIPTLNVSVSQFTYINFHSGKQSVSISLAAMKRQNSKD